MMATGEISHILAQDDRSGFLVDDDFRPAVRIYGEILHLRDELDGPGCPLFRQIDGNEGRAYSFRGGTLALSKILDADA